MYGGLNWGYNKVSLDDAQSKWTKGTHDFEPVNMRDIHTMDKSEIISKRDEKTIPHLRQYAPVWLVSEQFLEADDAVLFNVVFYHHLYGWVNRRYRYDGFNDVLYHKGQQTVSEDEAVELQENEPYVNTTVADIPNTYGG